MKFIFSAAFLILVVASGLTMLWMPEVGSEVPVLYWVTDPNPAREKQIEKFHAWLETHYGDELEERYGFRRYELRLDTANRDVSKMIIQGVSGVGGDIMDIGSGAGMRYLHSVGLLTDVTEDAARLGFGPDLTYPSMEPEITNNGRQYMFPCNVWCNMLWVNKATFEKHNQPLPPRRWSFDDFERLGKRFVDAANPPGRHRRVFFVNNLNHVSLRRSLGLSLFNETMTACTLGDPRNIRMMETLHKWTYEDHILPSPSDMASFSSEAGYGGSALQLFNEGNFAMVRMGRYALIQLREFGNLPLAVCELPHGDFPNNFIGTRAAGIYTGSKYKDLAVYFLAFLASETYNLHIVEDADALPPNPRYTNTEEYLRPAKYPNEWGCHEVFSETANTIAIGGVYSPFILPQVASRYDYAMLDAFMSGKYPAEEAAKIATRQIEEEIQRMIRENPRLRPRHESLLERQEKIEEKKRAGEKIPFDWIENPFYRRYYASMNMVE